MSLLSANNTQLSYVYDPMCSWCWGYRPTWLALQQALKEQLPEIKINYLLGGLAEDSNVPMAQDMQEFLAQTWHKIADQLGTEFNFDFWLHCKPRRSTYPACRACLVARESGLEEQMNCAIQQAYYLQAKNPSDDSTLIAIAEQLGLDKTDFSEQLSAATTQQKLSAEIESARALPIRGFPSLVLNVNGVHHAISLDYKQWQTSFDEIKRQLNLIS